MVSGFAPARWLTSAAASEPPRRERAYDPAESHAFPTCRQIDAGERRDVLGPGDRAQSRQRTGQGGGRVLAPTLVEDGHGEAAREERTHRVPEPDARELLRRRRVELGKHQSRGQPGRAAEEQATGDLVARGPRNLA